MTWAGRPLMAYLLYVPAAVAGVLLPHMVAGRMHPQHFLWGFALFTGAMAELLSWAGLGLAYTLAAWAMCALGLATVCAVVSHLPQQQLEFFGIVIQTCSLNMAARHAVSMPCATLPCGSVVTGPPSYDNPAFLNVQMLNTLDVPNEQRQQMMQQA